MLNTDLVPKQDLPAHPATVNSEDLTAYVSAASACQENGSALEVLRRTPFSSRDALKDARIPRLVPHQSLVHVCRNVAGGNSVDVDAVGGPLVGKGLGKLSNTALGRRVGGNVETTLEGDKRGNVNDGATAASSVRCSCQEVGTKVSVECPHGCEIDLKDLNVQQGQLA